MPPRRSRPSSGFAVRTVYVDAARTRNANNARTRDDRFTTSLREVGTLGTGVVTQSRPRNVERTVYGDDQGSGQKAFAANSTLQTRETATQCHDISGHQN
ncbi:hypothetical protein GCM10027269_80370 [Kribbella endophytica]